MQASQISRIELDKIGQSFTNHEHRVQLFQNLSLTIEQNKSYAITGPSGSGKSSLLMLMSGLENPTTGRGHYVSDAGISSLSELRANIGFIFQQFHLLPELTALNNVALPLKLRGQRDAEHKAREWLNKVGLSHRLDHKPSQLSGGEQQRVAIARALVFNPKFIFADEPTGNLDSQSANDVADILFSCCEERGAGLVMVTHSETLAARAQQIFMFKDGDCIALPAQEREVKHA